MLDQIEKALYAEDPKFANSVRARDPRVHYRRRIIQAVVGFLLGAGLLVAGIVINRLWMSVVGFVVMLACVMWALTSWRHMIGTIARRAPAQQRKRSSREQGTGFMERMEERWRRRQEGDG
jgi:hypothetical protein